MSRLRRLRLTLRRLSSEPVLCFFVMVFVCLGYATWRSQRSPSPPEHPLAHIFGRRDDQDDVIEIACGDLYIHDVDGVPRCTADETVYRHRRVWHRTSIDGWLLLKTDSGYLWSDDRIRIKRGAVYRDPSFHWRFESHQRTLVNRRRPTQPVQIIDEDQKPGVLALTAFYSVLEPRIVTETELEDSRRVEARVKQGEARVEARVMAGVRKIFSASRRRGDRNVISMGLYGSNPKYVQGAIKNADLVETFFPTWILRIYADASVPEDVIAQLRARRWVDVKIVRHRSGAAAGMFWRFFVADDPSVSRFIVRDADSRLNARDAAAVADWMASPYSVHSLRDHPNHDRPMNGGMWGATNSTAVAGHMRRFAKAFSDHDTYGADLSFLDTVIFPLVQADLLAHDAFSCFKYINSRPFPTQRKRSFQHVGQVFDDFDRPRMDDIDSFLRGRPAPPACRGHPDWTYG